MMNDLVKSESENQTEFDQYLDAKGLNCPLPILKSKLLLNKMQADKILFVEATDPHSQVDFEAYCARTEHEIINSTLSEGVYSFTIKRAHNPKKI
jgi:tRNA 2-thiouridine synthesizing protein A